MRESTAFIKMKVDYTLYMVTDSTKAILADRDLVTVVKEACEGGMQCLFENHVEYLDTKHFLRIS